MSSYKPQLGETDWVSFGFEQRTFDTCVHVGVGWLF